MDHQASGDHSGVDGASGSALPWLGVGLRKERRRVLVATGAIRHREHANHLPQHSSIDPETAAVLDGPPNYGSRRDAVDAAKDGLAHGLLGPKPIGNSSNRNCPIE